MYGNIPYMFDCWADPGIHLLLLKSSIVERIINCGQPNRLKPGPTILLISHLSLNTLDKMDRVDNHVPAQTDVSSFVGAPKKLTALSSSI